MESLNEILLSEDKIYIKDVEINEEVKEPPQDYIYIKDGELYCTKCDFIGMYICHNECCICEAKWQKGMEPKDEEYMEDEEEQLEYEDKFLEYEEHMNDEEDDLLPPHASDPLVRELSILHNPAPLVMQLSIPHAPTSSLLFRDYNKRLDDLLEDRMKQLSIQHHIN